VTGDSNEVILSLLFVISMNFYMLSSYDYDLVSERWSDCNRSVHTCSLQFSCTHGPFFQFQFLICFA
jgi:hypothetical protein